MKNIFPTIKYSSPNKSPGINQIIERCIAENKDSPIFPIKNMIVRTMNSTNDSIKKGTKNTIIQM